MKKRAFSGQTPVPAWTSGNPSFTSEQHASVRTCKLSGGDDAKGVVKNQGDTASFVCAPFPSNTNSTGDAVEDLGNLAGPESQAGTAAAKFVHEESGSGNADGVLPGLAVPTNSPGSVKIEEGEQSIRGTAGNSNLSDFPLRFVRRRDCSRTRSASAPIFAQQGHDGVKGEAGVVDIDNVSRMELKQLDNEKKLRRRLGKRRRSGPRNLDGEARAVGKSDSTPRHRSRRSRRTVAGDGTTEADRRRRACSRKRRRNHASGKDIPFDFGAEHDQARRKSRKRRKLSKDGVAEGMVENRKNSHHRWHRYQRKRRPGRGEKHDLATAVSGEEGARSVGKGTAQPSYEVPHPGTASTGAESLGLKGSFPLHSSEWLRAKSSRFAYVPQVNDDVTYFPQGHREAIKASRAAGIEPLLCSLDGRNAKRPVLNGSQGQGLDSSLTFRIVAIEYHFPVRVGAGLKGRRGKRSSKKEAALLQCLRVPAVLVLRPTNGENAVNASVDAADANDVVLTYFPVDDLPEYVVLSARVQSAASSAWKEGDRFRILFLNEKRKWQYYNGFVRRVKKNVKVSPWNAIEVGYDNEGESEKENLDYVSPWELESAVARQGDNDDLSVAPPPLRGQGSGSDMELFCAISRNIEHLRQRDANFQLQAAWFLDPVESLATIDKYCDIVPCALDLGIVHARLGACYYRCFDAFVQDMALIRSNALLFNAGESEIAKAGSSVYARVIDLAERTKATFSGPQNSASASVHGFGGGNISRGVPSISAVGTTRSGPSRSMYPSQTRTTPSSSARFAVPGGRGRASGSSRGGSSHRLRPGSAATTATARTGHVSGHVTTGGTSSASFAAPPFGSGFRNLPPPPGVGHLVRHQTGEHLQPGSQFLQLQILHQQQMTQPQSQGLNQLHIEQQQPLSQSRQVYLQQAYPQYQPQYLGGGPSASLPQLQMSGSNSSFGNGVGNFQLPSVLPNAQNVVHPPGGISFPPLASISPALPNPVPMATSIGPSGIYGGQGGPPRGVPGGLARQSFATMGAAVAPRRETRNSARTHSGPPVHHFGDANPPSGHELRRDQHPPSVFTPNAPLAPTISLPMQSPSEGLNRGRPISSARPSPTPSAGSGLVIGSNRRLNMSSAESAGMNPVVSRFAPSASAAQSGGSSGMVNAALLSGTPAVESGGTQSCAGSTEAAGGLPIHASTSESRFMASGGAGAGSQSGNPVRPGVRSSGQVFVEPVVFNSAARGGERGSTTGGAGSSAVRQGGEGILITPATVQREDSSISIAVQSNSGCAGPQHSPTGSRER